MNNDLILLLMCYSRLFKDIRPKKNIPSVNPSRIYGDSWEMEEGR